MGRFLKLSILAALLAAALLSFACGKGKHPAATLPSAGSGGLQTADTAIVGSGGFPTADSPPTEQSLDEVLSDLDVLPCPEGVDSSLWSELKSALADRLTTDNQKPTTARIASAPPTGEPNRVNDLSLTDNGDGTFTLSWHYRNLGDYDQNGVVAISDITPLAQHFGETVPADDLNRNSLQAVIDGSGNGKVGIEDITPIAVHFGMEVADYLIEGATALEGPFSEVGTVSVDSATGAETGRAVVEHVLTPGEYSYFRVTARDAAGIPGEPSSTVGLALQILSVTPTEVKEGTVVTFSAEVLGAGPLSYEWDFGGQAVPATSAEPSPKAVLTRDTGEFPASLTVTGPMGGTTFPFTLSKLAREWKYEVVLSTDKEYEQVWLGRLREYEGTLFFRAGITDFEQPGGTPVASYTISGTPGNWESESPPVGGLLDLNSEGALGFLGAGGSFMNYSLVLLEKNNGSWTSETIATGLTFFLCDFAYADGDVPFVAYIYRNYVPELAVELRYARRVGGEWLHGVIDDAGGPGGEVQAPIIMRADPEGNPAVAYRAVVDDRKELRLARWSPATEEWEREQVIADLWSQYDLAFDRQGWPCFIFADYGSTTDTLAVYYTSLDGGVLEQEIIEEWPKEEVMNVLSSFNLAHDPVGNPLVVAYIGDAYSRVWWRDGTAWEAVTDLSGTYFRTGIGGGPNQLSFLVTAAGTPYITFAASHNWDDGPKEVMLVSYE